MIVQRLVAMLQANAYAQIVETGDDRYYITRYRLPGDDKEYQVEYFDMQPVTVQFDEKRLTMTGEGI